MELEKRKNWHKIALNKNLSFITYTQLNNDPIYKVLNIVTRIKLYEGKSRYLALKTINNFETK